MAAQNLASRFRLDPSRNTHIKKRPDFITSLPREEMATSLRPKRVLPNSVYYPGHKPRGVMSSSQHSFTAALKALQARPGNGWDYLSSTSSVLNPKWNEAEKYICNPFSGEIPVECLSTKTLNGRAVHISGRMAKSGPLLGTETRLIKIRNNAIAFEGEDACRIAYAEVAPMRRHNLPTRDVGTQSNFPEQSSRSSNGCSESSSTFKDSSFTSYSSGGSSSYIMSQKLKTFKEDIEESEEVNQISLERKEKKLIKKLKSWTCLTIGLMLLRPLKKRSEL